MKLKVAALAVRWILPAVSLSGLTASAQQLDPAVRLQTAREVYSLRTIDEKPWHLKVDVTVFDDQGKKPQMGAIEVWHSGTNERESWSFADSTYTEMNLDGKTYRATSGPQISYRAEELLDHILLAGPDLNTEKGKPELDVHSFGKTKLDCIVSHPGFYTGSAPLGLFPTFCFQPGGDTLVVDYDSGVEATVISSTGQFLGHKVPLKLELQGNGLVLGKASVITLSTYTPTSDEFTPGPDLKTGSSPARIAGGIIAGSRLHFTPPVYPQSAKEGHISGTVLLHAIIGKDGRIHRLHPVAGTDLSLMISAVEAVSQWTYKPYILNGEPTNVDTTITVNFELR